MPGKNARSRAWCFTLNNYTDEELARVRGVDCKYLIIGFEEGDEGTPHLQGYVYFDNAKSFAAAKKAVSSRAHLEEAKGNPQQNYEYCSKGGNFEEKGVLPMSAKQKGQTEKDRWDAIKQAAKEGRMEDIESKVFVTHYPRLKAIKTDYMPRVASRPELVDEWVYGRSGVGKSTYAHRELPDAYEKPLTKWWDGYQPGQSVIIDDMDVFHKDLGYLFKIWCDHYSFIAETKGGAMKIRPPKIIVTSQYHPRDIWSNETLEAITRRVKIVHMLEPFPKNAKEKKGGVPPTPTYTNYLLPPQQKLVSEDGTQTDQEVLPQAPAASPVQSDVEMDPPQSEDEGDLFDA